MKLDQLRKIIREEVRAAVKEELQDVMTEAVKIASAPSTQPLAKANAYTPVEPTQQKVWSTVPKGKPVPLEEMLSQTKISMTSQDAKNFIGGGGAHKPNLASRGVQELAMGGGDAGISLDSIPGWDASKATAILKAAEEKTKQRAGN